jgi:uncharacterized protein YbaP (TraB family)
MKRILLLAAALAGLAVAAVAAEAPTAKAPAKAAASAPAPVPAAKQDYQPRPALWLLADEDTKIYLFGTVHILPPGFRWRSPAVDRAVADAAELVVEDYQPADQKEAAVEAMVGEMMLPAPSPILRRVPKDKREAVRKAMAQSGIEANAFDRLKTWAAGLMLGLGQLLGSYGVEHEDQAPGVEDVLEAAFEKAGKPISSIEDGDAVIRALSAIPEAEQVRLLVEAAEAAPTAIADSNEDDHDWARGDVDAIGATMREDLPPAMFDVLVTRRNAEWTGWLAERLKRPGTLLVAVGAGHLAGDTSVQHMLARRGLKVRRIN